MRVKASRKLLKERKEEDANVKDGQYRHRKAKEDPKSFATPQNIGIVVTGTFVLCCGVLCPCFYQKRRRTVQRALDKEQQSGELLVLLNSFAFRDNEGYCYLWILHHPCPIKAIERLI